MRVATIRPNLPENRFKQALGETFTPVAPALPRVPEDLTRSRVVRAAFGPVGLRSRRTAPVVALKIGRQIRGQPQYRSIISRHTPYAVRRSTRNKCILMVTAHGMCLLPFLQRHMECAFYPCFMERYGG